MIIRGFILLAIGAAGLLVNEFGWLWTRSTKVTLIFAVVAAAGLIYLVWSFWKRRA
jgi:hypothetical protein